MRQRQISKLAALAALTVMQAFTLLAQGVIVCRKCGKEDRAGGSECVHCQTELPKPRVVPKAEPKPPPAPVKTEAEETKAESERGAASVVEACVRQARELEAKQPDIAFAYWQNALALMRLVPAGTWPESASEAILTGNTRTMQMLLRGPVPCKRCNGTGKYQLDLSKVDRKQGTKSVEGLPCATCKGAGAAVGFRDVAKVKMAILQGRTEFERRQMVAGDVKVGRTLVPAALDKNLTNRQRALIMTAMPAPCSECQLCGRQSCSPCKGSGWKKCDYTGCKQGILEEQTKSGVRKEKRINEESTNKCPKCDGLAEIPCTICAGTGGVACKKCDGSGLAPRCTRCSATGLSPCRTCRETGEVKGAPCPDCKGERLSLCTSCRGEGAVTR